MTRAIHVGLAVVLVCGCATAPIPTTTPLPTPPASPTPTARATSTLQANPTAPPLVRLPLDADGPVDLSVVGNEAWIVASDSSELLKVSLETGFESARLSAPSMPTILEVDSNDQAFVGLLDSANGEHILAVDPLTEATHGIPSNVPGGLSATDDGLLWVLEQQGTLALVDPAAGTTLRDTEVEVDTNRHMNVLAVDGSAWVASDPTPLFRVSQDQLDVEATIDVGGGIPFVSDSGLLWGARPDELWAVDPATNRVVRRIPLADLIEVLALDVEGNEVWIAARHPGYVGTVIRLDLETGLQVSEWAVSLPAAISVAFSRAWVVDYETDELIGIPR